jgi:hypothetical protein
LKALGGESSRRPGRFDGGINNQHGLLFDLGARDEG